MIKNYSSFNHLHGWLKEKNINVTGLKMPGMVNYSKRSEI